MELMRIGREGVGQGDLLEERPTEIEDHGQKPPVRAVASSPTAGTTGVILIYREARRGGGA